MSFPPSQYKTYVSGETLTAADLNASLAVIASSNIPEDIDDYSTNSTEMGVTTDPYPAGSPSLATNLSGELERLRYVQAQVTGKTNWYEDPDMSIATIATGTATFAGPKTFSGNVTLSGTASVLSVAGTTTLTGNVAATGTAATFTVAGTADFTGVLKGKGTTGTDSAASGYIGEYNITSDGGTVTAGTTGQFKNYQTDSVGAGDWDVYGAITMDVNSATTTGHQVVLSLYSDNTTTDHASGHNLIVNTESLTAGVFTKLVGPFRVSVNSSTTVCLKMRWDYSSGTPRGIAGKIWRRRVR